MTDVTERNKAEKSLREAINYVENLLRTANVIIVELGLDGSVIRLNSAAEAVTGYRFEELRGRNWFEVVVPKDHYPDVWQEFEHITTTRGLPAEFENPILTRTGEVRHIVWRNSMIIRDEQVAGTLSFGIDLTEKKNMQDRLNQSESLLREAQSLAHIGHWTYDYQTHEWIWSDELFRILGLDPSQTHPSLKAFLDVVHEEDRVRVNDTYQQFLNSCQSDELDFQLLMHDGNNKFVKQRFEAVLDNEGTPSRLFGILQDETLEILQELGLKESEERFRTVANYTYDWEYWEGPRKEMLFTSPSCERITGYVPVDFVCDPELLQKIVHPEDRAAWEAHQCGIHEDDYGELSFRIVRKDGEIRWIAHGCQGVYARNGQFRGRRSSNRDITDLKQAEQLAHQLAYFDSLTNLPNRRMLMDRMGNALAQAKRSHRSMAVMFLDLDHFKQINDTLGHTIGDKLLIAVADRLTTCVRQGDTVSRTGGDEFIVLLPELAHPGDARTVAEKFIQVLSSPIEIQGNVIETSISIGISIHPADGTGDSEELMTKADSAMYEAKRAGRNCYLVSDP